MTEKKKEGFNLKLIPMLLIMGILPFLVYRHPYSKAMFGEYSWFVDGVGGVDTYLYPKMIFFSVISLFMLIDIVTSLVSMKKAERLSFANRFLPMGIYVVFVIISTIFALDKSASLKGAFDQVEPVMVLIGYTVTVPYVFISVKSEKDIKFIYYAVFFSSFITCFVGALQYFGHNPFETEWFLHLITEEKFYEMLEGTDQGTGIYSTFGNMNYVGSYVCVVLPIVFSAFFTKYGKLTKIFAAILTPALVFLLIASRSKTGLAILVAEVGVFALFRFRFLFKRWYILLPVVVLVVAAFIKYDSTRDFYYINTLKKTLKPEKTDFALTGIETKEDCIRLTYKGSEIEIRRIFRQRQQLEALENGTQIEIKQTNIQKGSLVLQSGEELGYTLETDENSNDIITIQVVHTLVFKYDRETGDYKIRNAYGGWDESIIRPNVLEGYERLATGRGYIWGITIPVLKDYIIIGAGPDNYPVAMGLNGEDYAKQLNASFYGNICLRPHNYYLQMAMATGVLSLICVLVFFVIYIIGCFRKLFWRKLDTNSQRFAFFCMLAVVGFLGCGIANDSLVSVTPLFWTALGLGYTMNSKELEAEKKEE